MACNTRPGVKPFLDALSVVAGEKITQQDWHDLRELAREDGTGEMTRTQANPDDIEEGFYEATMRCADEAGVDWGGYDMEMDGNFNYDDRKDPNPPRILGGRDEPPYYETDPDDPSDDAEAVSREYQKALAAVKNERVTDATVATLYFIGYKGLKGNLKAVREARKAKATEQRAAAMTPPPAPKPLPRGTRGYILMTDQKANPADPAKIPYFEKASVAYVVEREGTQKTKSQRVFTSYGEIDGWQVGAVAPCTADQSRRDMGDYRILGKVKGDGTSEGFVPDKPLPFGVFK